MHIAVKVVFPRLLPPATNAGRLLKQEAGLEPVPCLQREKPGVMTAREKLAGVASVLFLTSVINVAFGLLKLAGVQRRDRCMCMYELYKGRNSVLCISECLMRVSVAQVDSILA